MSNLYELMSLVGGFDPDGTDRARANIILHKLVTDGIIDQQVRRLRGEDVHAYVATVTTTVEKFDVDYAKEHKSALISGYLDRTQTDVPQR